jgi:hypothetical protein
MANETNQDPQKPTQDQPPPKQYATPRPGQSGERGTDERAPKIPNQVESSEGDDEDRRAAEQGPEYDEDASVKGTRGGTDKQPRPSGGSGTTKPGGESARQGPGSSGESGRSPGSGNLGGGRSDK